MKRFLSFVFLLMLVALAVNAQQSKAKQNRGLFAFYDGVSTDKGVKVSWRMRDTDDPYLTKYRLYATDTKGVKKFIGTYTNVTYVKLTGTTYSNYTFSLVVLDKNNKEIDRQEGVKVQSSAALDIPMNMPRIINEVVDTVLIGYTPGDCSAYDMDGDGEQEIIVKWMADAGTKCIGSRIYTAHAFYDCYKLDGTRLWRIDGGQNTNAGNNAAFFCWDFDGDGIGEMMIKSAPGTKDALGHYCGSAAKSNTGEDLPGYADTLKYYRRGSDGLPTYGVWKAVNGNLSLVTNSKSYEWVTVFSGKTGEELGSCDYWPYFNIQDNWNPGGNSDGAGYGRRGCSQKGGVMKIPCKDGVVRPTSCFQRGAYTYVYCTDFSWDGKKLQEEWRNASEKTTGTANSSYRILDGVKKYSNKSLYAQGAHPSETADIDGDGYDELMVGAAALDHDGTVLWSTGLGHGDAVAVGDLNPAHPGIEVWRITEGATKYDACMIDGATGEVMNGQLVTGGDVQRGLCIDIDSTHVGTEYVHNNSSYFYDCDGNALYTKNFTSNTGYPNYRIFWDGDLCEEHFSGTCISKFSVNGSTASNSRISCPGSGTNMLWKYWSVSSINGTKDNPCLQCDLYGDWREELVMFTVPSNSTAKCSDGSTTDYILRTLTTSWGTDKKIPWLRDDNTYSKEIACQNIGYSQPPHLGYNPFVYYDSLKAHVPEIKFEPIEGKNYYVTFDGLKYLDFSATPTSLGYIPLSDSLTTVQFEKAAAENAYYIKGNGKYLADYNTLGLQFVSTAAEATAYTAIPYASGVLFKSGTKYIGSNNTGLNRTSIATSKRYFTVELADSSVKADVNNDGSVDISDVNAVIAVICDGENVTNADVNGDGAVDISDVNAVISVICGL